MIPLQLFFVYPVNNTTSVENKNSQNSFIIKENILQLYKKEVVVKNIIKIICIVLL